jgi:hypothetical protein
MACESQPTRIKNGIELARKLHDASTERRLGIGGRRASAC